MKPIKLKTWIIWSLILIALGLVADYFLLHRFFQDSPRVTKNIYINKSLTPPSSSAPETAAPVVATNKEDSAKDNFAASLKKCAPDFVNPNVNSPDSLIEYLSREIGVKKKDVLLENYHLELRDGSKRRIQVLGSDNTNSSDRIEVRFFKLDAEGIPERIPFPDGESIQSILNQSTITHHELRTHWVLNNKTALNLEFHNKSVFEFQITHLGKVLSCRYRSCFCP